MVALLAVARVSLAAPVLGASSWPSGWQVFDASNSPFQSDWVVTRMAVTSNDVLWVSASTDSGPRFVRGAAEDGAYRWRTYLSLEELVQDNFDELARSGGLPGMAELRNRHGIWTGSKWYDGATWRRIAALDMPEASVSRPPLFDEQGNGYVVARIANGNGSYAIGFDSEGGLVRREPMDPSVSDQLLLSDQGSIWATTESCAVCLTCAAPGKSACFPSGLHRAVLGVAADAAFTDRRGKVQVLAVGSRDPIYVSRVARLELDDDQWQTHWLDLGKFQMVVGLEWAGCGDRQFVATESSLVPSDAAMGTHREFRWPDESTVGGWQDLVVHHGKIWLGGLGGLVGGRLSDLGFSSSDCAFLYLPRTLAGP